jgi:hypothetical protein
VQTPTGPAWATADAPDWTGRSPAGSAVKIAITKSRIAALASRGQRTILGQWYGIVQPGLILTQHVFEGLKRGMLVDHDGRADMKKLAFTWAAKRDATLVGPAHDARVEFCDAPKDRVFVVYVSPNEMLEQYPDIAGWAEHWAWVAANPSLPAAPVDSDSRYDRRLWSAPPR